MTRLLALPLLLLLAACASTPPLDRASFLDALTSHCGMAYEGRLVSEDPRDADWQGKRMIAHWASCEDGAPVAIALHMEDAEAPGGWDRSRTWLIEDPQQVLALNSAVEGPLVLRHDHRHADGKPDEVTMYGGTAQAGGSTLTGAIDFPVDPATIALFEREGLDASTTNVWRIEVDPAGMPDARFAYQLTRANDPTRIFRVEFDLSTPVPAPPPAWGHE